MKFPKIKSQLKPIIWSFSISLLLGIQILTGCGKKPTPKKINLGKKEDLDYTKQKPGGKSIRIAVGAMITPHQGYEYYKYLLEYIEAELKKPVEFVDRESYAEINQLLKERKLDGAFVCSGPYVDAHDDFGLELLVVPQAYGQKVYFSYIIVPADSTVKNVKDLKGKTFAFTDPDSNSGKRVPTYLLLQMGETPESFFKKYHFTYQHDKAIRAVSQKLVDGAAVDSLIWEYLNVTKPDITFKTKIIWKSDPFGIPPFVVHPRLDKNLKNRLKNILLNIHKSKKGKSILKGMMIDKFVISSDRSYNSIRVMNKALKKQNLK